PLTLPVYLVPPTVKLISSPRSLPSPIGLLPRVPLSVWNCWVKVSVFPPSFHAPSTLAGTIHKCAVHQLVQSPPMVSDWSGCQLSIVNEFETMRVPGAMFRMVGRSRRLIEGSRNSVMTCAFE